MNRIFIADDSKIARKVLGNILTEHGYIIVGEACNGQEAVDNFQAAKPDLITLDITMPVLDGIKALEGIRALDSKVKVVMISAAGQKDKVIAALKAGADEFIQKPIEEENTLEVISKVLG